MGRMKEVAMEEERIKFERAEAAFLALPEAQIETLDGIKDLIASHKDLLMQNGILSKELAELQTEFKDQNSWKTKWKERLIGFILGVIASLVAALIF